MRSIPSILRIFTAIAIIATIGTYAYFKSENFLAGPTLDVSSLTDGMTVTDPLITVKGTASHISFINMNDRKIFTDQDGTFSEEMLLYPGYNVVTVSADDRFNRHTEKTIEIVYSPAHTGVKTALNTTGLPAAN